jgi:hypothetical protein
MVEPSLERHLTLRTVEIGTQNAKPAELGAVDGSWQD